ncbi:hypothetical protein [Massilia sp. METH4]|uniref:hypothetical protein n=1 Tax=Massilia sp. METH4 TaxID=3123041 RepID=UPI0030CDD684
MDFDYNATAADARQTLIDFGGAEPGLVFTRTMAGAFDPSGEPASGTTTWAAIGLTFAYGLGATTAPGSLIQAGDLQAFVAALDLSGAPLLVPAKPDRCLAPDGHTYTVESVKATAPAGVPVLYEIQLSR